jgi:hypothetical protein
MATPNVVENSLADLGGEGGPLKLGGEIGRLVGHGTYKMRV